MQRGRPLRWPRRLTRTDRRGFARSRRWTQTDRRARWRQMDRRARWRQTDRRVRWRRRDRRARWRRRDRRARWRRRDPGVRGRQKGHSERWSRTDQQAWRSQTDPAPRHPPWARRVAAAVALVANPKQVGLRRRLRCRCQLRGSIAKARQAKICGRTAGGSRAPLGLRRELARRPGTAWHLRRAVAAACPLATDSS